LDAGKQQGEYPSRPKLLGLQQIKHSRKMLGQGEKTNERVAALFDVDRTTIWQA
jgi:hypothetical protein